MDKKKSGNKMEVEKDENHIALWPQVFGALTAGMGAAMMGVVWAYPTRAMPQLIAEEDLNIQLSQEAAAWFAAMQMLCGVVLCPLGGLLSNFLGRKISFIGCSLFCIVGWIMIALSSNSAVLFVGRFSTNIGEVGIVPSLCVYICETAHPKYRSGLTVFLTIFASIGMLIVLGIGYVIPYWRHLAWVCMVPGCLTFVMIIFLPDTPYWLVEMKRNDEAIKSLQFFRGSKYDITNEINEIKSKNEEKINISKGSSGTLNILKRLASPAFGRPFLCIGVLGLILQWGEFANLIIYMISIFQESNYFIEPQLVPLIAGSTQLLASSVSSIVMSKFSPRLIYILCLGVVGLSDIGLATYFYFNTTPGYDLYLESVQWLPLLFVLIIITGNLIGCMPGYQLILGEIFPSDIRALSIGLTEAVKMGMGTLNVLAFNPMKNTFQLFGNFYFYGCVTLIACCWAIYILPDNRGLSLVKIENKFEEGKKSTLKMNKGQP